MAEHQKQSSVHTPFHSRGPMHGFFICLRSFFPFLTRFAGAPVFAFKRACPRLVARPPSLHFPSSPPHTCISQEARFSLRLASELEMKIAEKLRRKIFEPRFGFPNFTVSSTAGPYKKKTDTFVVVTLSFLRCVLLHMVCFCATVTAGGQDNWPPDTK